MLAMSPHLMAEHGFVEKEPDVWNSTGQALTQQWAPATYYNEGDTVCLGNNCWIVIVPGLSGGTAPTSTSGTETNGDVTFQAYDTNSPSFIEQQIQLEADNDDEEEDDPLVIEKIDQDALMLADQQWSGNEMTLNVTGGSGDGEITSYISTYEENCTVSTTGVVTRINDDADALCTITVTKAGDEVYNPVNGSWLIDMTSDLTPQAAFDILVNFFNDEWIVFLFIVIIFIVIIRFKLDLLFYKGRAIGVIGLKGNVAIGFCPRG